MKKLITIALLALATTAHAKIGDTFIDPEFGKITVKGPSFENLELTKLYKRVNGKDVLKDHPQNNMGQKASRASATISNLTKKLNPNMSEQDIIEVTKITIDGFRELNQLRKVIYLDGYNEYMLMNYPDRIMEAQVFFKRDFLDYFMKIKGTTEFEELKKEINFSTQILKNLKLYQ
ncbi:hypothetical protein V6W59_04525 [Mannheimia sp. HC-2023]|uniref:hypothetical protein n=1 Tax=Mannheimia indoligenes TaxID=3103145 RepID=UPI002FE6A426